MRNWIWSACLAGVAATAAAAGTGYYAYQNPDSLLGRCAATTVLMGAQNNPLLYGLSAASPSLTSLEDGVALNDPAVSDAEEADAPLSLDDGRAALLRFGDPRETSGLTIIKVSSVQEPPLALSQSTRFMPYCVRDNDCACASCPLTWFTKSLEHCWTVAQRMTERNWLTCWLGGVSSSPTMLPAQGDEETAEPRDQKEPDACKEDPNLPYHHSGCPFGSGACPYSGKMPTYTAPQTVKPAGGSEEQSEPPTPTKHKFKWPKLGGEEASELNPVHPEVDTMEFRKSDRAWDDYGTPSGL